MNRACWGLLLAVLAYPGQIWAQAAPAAPAPVDPAAPAPLDPAPPAPINPPVQIAPPTQTEPPEFLPRPSFTSRVGNGIGYTGGYNRIGTFLPLRQEADDFLTFSDFRYYMDYSGHIGGSIGLGHRIYSPEWNRTFGAYLYGDARNTEYTTFAQMSGGIESFGQWVDFRSNFYVPIGTLSGQASAFTAIGNPFLQGNNILAFGSRRVDQAMTGTDAQWSAVVPWVNGVRAFAGYYWFTGTGTHDAIGARVGADAQVNDYVNTTVAIQSDRVFGTNVLGSLTFAWPGRRRNPHRTDIRVASRLADSVDKLDLIVVNQQNRTGNYVYDDPRTGNPIQVIYADATAPAGGNGTVEHPFQNLAQAQNVLQQYDVLFVNSGTYYTALTLPKDVTVFGDGTANTLATTNGTIIFPKDTPGAQEVIFNINGPGITLASGDLVSGMTINGSANGSPTTTSSSVSMGIYGDNANNVTLVNNTILNTGEEGIKLTGPSGTVVVSNNKISDTGQNGPLGGGDAINISSNGTNTQNLTVSNNTISTLNANTGIGLKVNTGSVMNASVTGNTVTTASADKDGIQVESFTTAATPSNITIQGNTFNQAGNNGSMTDGAVKFLGTSGTINTTISGNTFAMSNSSTNAVVLNSASSGVINATVSNNLNITGTYNDAVKLIAMDGSTLNATISGNTPTGTYANAVEINQMTQSTGTPPLFNSSTVTATIQNNTFAMNKVGANGVLVNTSDGTSANVTVANNVFSGTYGDAVNLNSALNSSLTSAINSNSISGTFANGVAATSNDLSQMSITATSNVIPTTGSGATADGMIFTGNNFSNLNVIASNNSVTGSHTAGIAELLNNSAVGTGQFYNNVTLTGNAANDLALETNGAGTLLTAKATGNAVGGTINLINNAGAFFIDGDPVTLNPGATVNVGPGVTTGQNNFP